jgi:hypothetical protein
MDSLARQISTPLDWEACLSAVLEMQPDVLLEIGPGNALARIELRVMFEDLLTRDVTIERTGSIDYLRSNFVHGIKRMPVKVS